MIQRLVLLTIFAASSFCGASAQAQSDDVKKALSYNPVQPNVEYETPNAKASRDCKLISAKKINKSGFVLIDGDGQVLRMFLNNGGDPNVDQWSYFQNGIEVYRDLDTDFDGKADEFRWFASGGSRRGKDTDGDNIIDQWLVISAEEVSAEVVAAMKTRDSKRFNALLLTEKELNALGLSKENQSRVAERIKSTRTNFLKMVSRQKLVGRETNWVHFGGQRPSVIPSGHANASRDIMIYDNVAAVVQNGQKHGQLSIGTLVKSGQAWRVTDLPFVLDDEDVVIQSSLFLMPDERFMLAESAVVPANTGSNPAQQKMFEELETLAIKFDDARKKNDSEALADLNQDRADLIKKIAASIEDPKQKSAWIRQFADTVAGAFQSGEFPDGLKVVSAYYSQLKNEKIEREDLGYLLYRMVSARYSRMFEEAEPDEVSKVQEKYLEDLEKFVEVYPKIEQAADAMLQLALWGEFSSTDDTTEAQKWYKRITKNFPKSETADKARGALVRLQSVGKPIRFAGPIIDSSKTYRIGEDSGKVVLIHYWATAPDMDYSELKRLFAKYRRKGFNIVSVNLDDDPKKAMASIRKTKLPGVHLFEKGGTESPLSTQLGIALIPTMILVDQDGKVTNRNIRLGELEKSIDKLLK